MKFSKTLLFRTLSIPGNNWDRSCWYVFVLKLPAILLLLLFGIPVSIVIDFIWALSNVIED